MCCSPASKVRDSRLRCDTHGKLHPDDVCVLNHSKAIVESGVLPIIVRLVHSPNSDFQKHGSGALCCISHKYAKEVVRGDEWAPTFALRGLTL